MASAPNLRFINPANIAMPPGYTHVIEVSGPGRIIYIEGQLGLGLDDNSLARQATSERRRRRRLRT
jgi:hypothetical protein